MRETVGSLRVYFILLGVAVPLSALRQLRPLPRDPATAVLLALLGVVHLGFVAAGVRLPVWLRTRRDWIVRLIWTAMLLQWIDALYIGLSSRTAALGIAFIIFRPAFVALLGFYLLRNVRRLAAA